MSHFTVLVVTDDPGKVEELLAPFDENNETEPYRDYEKGGPEDFWAVRSFREQGKLPQGPLTWQQVADACNAEYAEEASKLHTDGERAWTMSTYPKGSKWDWYEIGGRWSGAFPYKKHDYCNQVLRAHTHWTMSDTDPIPPMHCDGGPKKLLDLEKMRSDAADEARKTYRRYQEAVKGTPEALPWSTFRDNISEGSGYTIQQAREEYNSQPRIRRLAEHEDFRWYIGGNLDKFSVSEDEYAEHARKGAVPGYALLTPEGQWIAPGEMGWWGMSSDTPEDKDAYLEKVNEYIDQLPGDMWLIMVDCHI